MEVSATGLALSPAGYEDAVKCQLIRLCCAALLLSATMLSVPSRAQKQPAAGTTSVKLTPEPAVPAILAAFNKYEVVGMPEAHEKKDLDDFILALIRDPSFPEKVNDIEVECGNSLYQPILDRYISGEDVPFTEVRKVWRNTTQEMCGTSGFFEQFFPLVREINRKLPPAERLRVLAGDPPINWEEVKSFQDYRKFDRKASIASVMEKEVLSKHRKALMLFGTFHLFHSGDDAVALYEKDYPNVTFIISDLGEFDADASPPSGSPFSTWSTPSLAAIKGTWFGALQLSRVFPPPIFIDQDCNVRNEFEKDLQKPMADLVDAILYLGPQSLRLKEQMPADVALDADYVMELLRRETIAGFPGDRTRTLPEWSQQIVNSANSPLFAAPIPPDLSRLAKSCLDRKSHGNRPQ